jgi:hypothetical protein
MWRSCFVCNKEMTPSCPPKDGKNGLLDPPSGGTGWRTRGNYGSVLWDSLTGHEQLHIIICDQCLKDRQKHVVSFFETSRIDRKDVKNWSPEED